MTALIKQIGIPLVFAAFTAGMAWGTSTLTLRNKVDKATYQDDMARRAALDSTIVRELRTIKYLQCRQQPADSYCQR